MLLILDEEGGEEKLGGEEKAVTKMHFMRKKPLFSIKEKENF